MDELFKIVSDYGLVVGFGAILAIGLIAYIKRSIFSDDKDFENLPSNHSHLVKLSEVKPNLSYHPFFANAQYRLNIEIPNLEILPTKPVKEQMFRDILKFYIQAMYTGCQEITTFDMESWGSDKWGSEMTKKFNEIMDDFSTNCENHGVPEIVLTKFAKWQHSTLEFLYGNIMSVGTSNIFNSNIDRTNTLFFILNLLLVTTIVDAEKTLKELNGEVSGKIYNGKVIED